jgi:hypothetical protein
MAINQLSTSNTFTDWLQATSSLIEVANSLTSNASGGLIANSSIFIQGEGASLNVRTLANINTLQANTANIGNTRFRESNVNIQLDLTVGRNLSTVSIYANEIYQKGANLLPLIQKVQPAYDHANAGFIHANSGFIKTNSAYDSVNAAFIHANSGFIQTNAAFDHANSGFIQANSAFVHANFGFTQTNTAYTQTNAAFITANSGFIQTNAAFDHANSGFIQANTSFARTNAAFNHANSGFIQANAAFDHANSGFIQANAAFNSANAAFIRANNSLDANNGGIVTGNVIVRSSVGIKVENDILQDAIILKGRNGGTSSYSATLVPDTLTSNVTVTIPGENFTVGFRNIPSAGDKAFYTLQVSDVGKYIKVAGAITIPNNTFSENDVVTLYNNTSTSKTIACDIAVAYIAAFDTDVSSVSLSPRGIATILFTTSNSCVIMGNAI